MNIVFEHYSHLHLISRFKVDNRLAPPSGRRGDMDRLHHQCGEPSCGVRHRHAKAPTSNSASLRQIQPAANCATRFVYLATRGGAGLSVAMASGALLQEERPGSTCAWAGSRPRRCPIQSFYPRRQCGEHSCGTRPRLAETTTGNSANSVRVIPLWTARSARLVRA